MMNKKLQHKCKNNNYSMKVLKDISSIEDIRFFWEKVQCDPNTDIDFFINVCNLRDDIIQPYAIVLYKNQIPESLVVGRIENMMFQIKFGYYNIYSTRIKSLVILHNGFLGKLANLNTTYLIDEITNTIKIKEADIAWFNHLVLDSSVYNKLRSITGCLSKNLFAKKSVHWKMTIPDSFEVFIQTRNKNMKHNYNKCKNRIKNKFVTNFEVKCFNKIDAIEEFLRDTEQIASGTYQRGLKAGFRNDMEMRYRTELFMGRGLFRGYLLYFNNKPVAFLNGALYGPIFYPWSTGYDSNYSFFSPGMYLFFELIKDLCDINGIRGIDFGFGDADYKRLYCDENWFEQSMYIFPPTTIGLKLSLFKTIEDGINRLSEMILIKLNAIQKLKKKWRTHLKRKK